MPNEPCINLCQPDSGKSCGACCGIYNYVGTLAITNTIIANNTLSIDVSDRGPGFVAVPVSDSCTEHLGLVGMRDRVASMGGQFILRSEPGCGTRVSADRSTSARSRRRAGASPAKVPSQPCS